MQVGAARMPEAIGDFISSWRITQLYQAFFRIYPEFTQGSREIPEIRIAPSCAPEKIGLVMLHTGDRIGDAIAAQNTTSHRLATLSEEIKELNGSVRAMEKLLQGV
jgi:hypothetical protein